MEGFYPSNSQAIAASRVPRLDTAMFTTFRGGQSGTWRVTLNSAVRGEGLAAVPALAITQSEAIAPPILPSPTAWRVAGAVSPVRHVGKTGKGQTGRNPPPPRRK